MFLRLLCILFVSSVFTTLSYSNDKPLSDKEFRDSLIAFENQTSQFVGSNADQQQASKQLSQLKTKAALSLKNPSWAIRLRSMMVLGLEIQHKSFKHYYFDAQELLKHLEQGPTVVDREFAAQQLWPHLGRILSQLDEEYGDTETIREFVLGAVDTLAAVGYSQVQDDAQKAAAKSLRSLGQYLAELILNSRDHLNPTGREAIFKVLTLSYGFVSLDENFTRYLLNRTNELKFFLKQIDSFGEAMDPTDTHVLRSEAMSLLTLAHLINSEKRATDCAEALARIGNLQFPKYSIH